MKIQLENSYDIKCTLGTIKDIENKFKKSFVEIVSSIDKMSTTDQIQMLYIGVRRNDETVDEKTFVTECEDTLGVGTLTEIIEDYILQLQYPGETKENIQKKILAKLETLQKMKASTGAQ